MRVSESITNVVFLNFKRHFPLQYTLLALHLMYVGKCKRLIKDSGEYEQISGKIY